MNQLLEFIKVI